MTQDQQARPGRRRRIRAALAALLLSGVGAGGCGQKIWITQYPAFWTPDLKSVAVMPFRSAVEDPNAGAVVSDSLANALGANRTYQVYNRNELKALMDERDIQIAFGSDPAAAVVEIRKLGKVQAVLTGAVTTYAATTSTQIMKIPNYQTREDGTTYIAGYTEIPVVRNEGNVAVTAALIRVADGTTIYATPEPVRGSVYSQGSGSASRDPHACLALATRQAVWQLVEHFAIIRKQVTVNPSRDFRTASDFYDNQWTFKDEFKTSDERMFVVVNLPPACDRNRFRIAIVRKDRREDLAEAEVLWRPQEVVGTGRNVGRGFEFSPRDLAAKGGGPGEYVAKFYSGPEPVMAHAFRINP